MGWGVECNRSNGFNKAQRLLTPSDYAWVFAHAKRLHSEHFSLIVRAHDDINQHAPDTSPSNKSLARLGLAISKKHAKTAVLRNIIKRTAREVFRHQRLCGVSVVLIAKKRLHRACATEYQKELLALFNQVPSCVSYCLQ